MIGKTVPVCVDEMVTTTGSRVEMWVTYRNPHGRIVTPPHGASATWKKIPLTMGSGDTWPAVDLAKVQFNQSGAPHMTSNHLVVDGPTDAAGLAQPSGIFKSQVQGAGTMSAPATTVSCPALPAGHRRRIFFGFSDVHVPDTFALGYEEVDQHGHVVPGSQSLPSGRQTITCDGSNCSS